MKRLLLIVPLLALFGALASAQTKISQLPAGTTPTGPEIFPAVQSGNTVGITASQVQSFLEAQQNAWIQTQTFTPGSTYALVANGQIGWPTIQVNSANTASGYDLAVFRNGSTAGTIGAGPDIELYDATNAAGTVLQQAGGQSEFWKYLGGAWVREMYTGTGHGLVMNGATGGDKGPGTLNATQVYVNGVAVGSGSGTVTSVGLALPSVFTVSGSPVTSSGTLTGAFTTGEPANELLATPSGTAGALGLRALVSADVPAISLTTTGQGGVIASGNAGYCYISAGTSAAPEFVPCPLPAINLNASGSGGVVENGLAGECLISGGSSAPPSWTPCAAGPTTGSTTLTYSSGCSSGSISPTVTWTQSGNTVTVRVTAAGTCTTVSTTASIIFTGMSGVGSEEPTGESIVPCAITNAGNPVIGSCIVGQSGFLNSLGIGPLNSTFGAGTSGVLKGTSFTYQLN